MPAVRIHDARRDTCLAFDLKEVLAALGPRGRSSWWTIGKVVSQDEALDAIGDGAEELETWMKAGARVSGAELTRVATTIRQVIWGQFAGYADQLSSTPWVTVIAFDSSWYEVQSDEPTVLESMARAFVDVKMVD